VSDHQVDVPFGAWEIKTLLLHYPNTAATGGRH